MSVQASAPGRLQVSTAYSSMAGEGEAEEQEGTMATAGPQSALLGAEAVGSGPGLSGPQCGGGGGAGPRWLPRVGGLSTLWACGSEEAEGD